MIRLATILLAVTLTLSPASASRETLTKLLPASSAVKNWPVLEGTLTYAKSADSLHLIYDGGDKLFLPVENIELISRYGTTWRSFNF